ncbi:hypothetical protein FHY25_003667 [Xanthomonas arboricola]|uniref:hypothetical protein n=1 Tax=Xanthomonas campestris TaxID=339 RepID=UPI0023E9773A|nr:hypothetical protein [Xanthomonas campestris]MCW2008965.1 hypothetical protein [Xanthomonas campestris]
MPLEENEIVPGVVAILDAASLNDNPDITCGDDKHVFRSGPFLCVQAKNGNSAWVSLTSQRDPRGLRLELRQEWRLEGSDVWRHSAQFVHDARKAFVGPNLAFVTAGAKELPHQPHNRPQVSEVGVAAVLSEMAKYRTVAL